MRSEWDSVFLRLFLAFTSWRKNGWHCSKHQSLHSKEKGRETKRLFPLRFECFVSKEKLPSRLLMSHWTELGYMPTHKPMAGKEGRNNFVV